MSVYVIDEIMGRGKTTAMIRAVNAAPLDKNYLFITPYLTEVARIATSCDRYFYEPEEDGGKLNNLKEALAAKASIASTHALFGMMDQEAVDLVMAGGYTLIIDEAPCVLDMPSATTYDMENIMEKYVKVEDDGRLVWTSDEYIGKYIPYRQEIEKGQSYAYGKTWITLMPLELFTSFKDVYIMTYMFNDQFVRCYFDMHGIQYTRKYIAGKSYDEYRLSDTEDPTPMTNFKSLVHICDSQKMNAIGDDYYALSKSMYLKEMRSPDSEMAKTLGKHTNNFFKHVAGPGDKTGVPTGKTMWTTFKKDQFGRTDWDACIMGTDPATGRRSRTSISPSAMVSCNARGTNNYRDRVALAYLINRFPHTAIQSYLSRYGIKLDRDRYALSELLQWIWRSAIRDGKEIWIYIPSKRMRTLLEDWLDEVSA